MDLFNKNKLDEIAKEFSIDEVISQLDFKHTIKLAWRMLYNDFYSYEQNEFGVHLLFALKKAKPDIWDSDWRYDALLGVACGYNYRYDEKYEALMSAYEKAKTVNEEDNPTLLISLADCYCVPGPPPITEDDALALVKRAIKDKIYKSGAWALSAIYHSKGDMVNHKKWKALAETLDSDAEELGPLFYPKFLWDEEILQKH